MEGEAAAANLNLHRSPSHLSTTSTRSGRSQTARVRVRKFTSYTSSSAGSVTPSDKSLTSFPSFSPGSPRDDPLLAGASAGSDTTTRDVNSPSPKQSQSSRASVNGLTAASPSQAARNALFDDAPLQTQHVPGSIHNATNEHIERLLARHGAVSFVRQISEDLAQRDVQMSALRRKAELRERALRKIILECGLSNLDLENRLREVEQDLKKNEASRPDERKASELEDLMSDAMSDTVILDGVDRDESGDKDATIRARVASGSLDDKAKGSVRGWKDYFWGNGSNRSSRASSINNTTIAGRGDSRRRSALQADLFSPPPRSGSIRSSSRASSMQSTHLPQDRKSSSSLAAFALRLVAGNASAVRENESSSRRSSMSFTEPDHRGRAATVAAGPTSGPTSGTVKAKNIPTARRPTVATVTLQQERWDTMGASPQGNPKRLDNYGPVEMDMILDPDTQPPTLTQIYNNQYGTEFLTDRFGFIYDQRRKKRQREANEMIKRSKRGSRVEMLSSNRAGLSQHLEDDEIQDSSENIDVRPDTPLSMEDREDDKPAKRWQDYLKIATFPTELLSHTPSSSAPTFEVVEGNEGSRSPGITSEERGFVPSVKPTAASTTISATDVNVSKPALAQQVTTLPKEDTEPVKLLLEQLSDVHDSLQREKTVKWNDFLRKVRAERRREGEAAAAAALAAVNEGRMQRAMAVMPEVSISDGEIIGISGLGNKGKVGRAKWNDFKQLLLGGIPVSYRSKIWAECSGATVLRVPGYYDDLVAQREGQDDPSVVAQIQMDINRTLTDNIFFRKGPGVAKLDEVLLAYSRRNPEVGYCQGMNLIAANLLLIMPTAEDAFWILASIIENILPHGYYDHSLLASRADQQVLRQYVSEILPRLSSHLEELSIELEALTFQWFLSVFTDCLSAEALFRVWDVVLCTNDGSTFLFQIALALLKLNEQQLLQCTTPAAVYTYINHQMTNHAISIDGLIHASEALRKVVKREEIKARREKAIEAEKELMRQREARNNLRRAERLAAAKENSSSGSSAVVEEGREGAREDSNTPLASQQSLSRLSHPSSGSLGSAAGEYDDDDISVSISERSPMPVEEETQLGLG